jgi:hypothetical protein
VGVTQVGVSRGWMEDNVLSSPPPSFIDPFSENDFSNRGGKFYKHFMRSFCYGRFHCMFLVSDIFLTVTRCIKTDSLSQVISYFCTFSLIFPTFSTLSHTFAVFCTLSHILSAFSTLSKIKHRALTSRCHETGLKLV